MSVRVVTIKRRDTRQLLRGQLVRTVTAATFALEATMKVRAPIRFGFLRGSVQADVDQVERTLTGTVNVGMEYGRFVEEGTVHMAAQPYARPSAKEVAARIPEIAKAQGGS